MRYAAERRSDLPGRSAGPPNGWAVSALAEAMLRWRGRQATGDRAAMPAPTPSLDGLETQAVTRFGRAGGPADLLIDLPHGATERLHYDRLRARLSGTLPAGLEAFFFVNTDIGVPEVAVAIGERLAQRRPELAVDVLRCLLPRTFVDCNRRLDGERPEGMTAGLPDYLRAPADRALLATLFRRYVVEAERLHGEVCGAGGLALALHSYAPRSVDVPVDDDIVASLRRAYRPEIYATWPERPEVDLITETLEGEPLAPTGLVEEVARRYAALGYSVGRNATYRLHPATMGFVHSRRYPGQILCLELRRDRLAAPFRPFAPSPIGPRKVARLARPLADALLTELDRRRA